jgi:hypothetical protein
MAQDRESQVRERAHAIWLEEGMPEGQADQHWSRAESEVADADTSAPSEPTKTADEDDSAAADQGATPAETAPEFNAAPEFENADPAPEPPVVAAIVEPVHAPAARKPTRRKTKS